MTRRSRVQHPAPATKEETPWLPGGVRSSCGWSPSLWVRLPAKIPSERARAEDLKVPFCSALDSSPASSLRSDPSDTNEARR